MPLFKFTIVQTTYRTVDCESLDEAYDIANATRKQLNEKKAHNQEIEVLSPEPVVRKAEVIPE